MFVRHPCKHSTRFFGDDCVSAVVAAAAVDVAAAVEVDMVLKRAKYARTVTVHSQCIAGGLPAERCEFADAWRSRHACGSVREQQQQQQK